MNNFIYPIIGAAQDIKSEGLTKRELFAAMAMQGILASGGSRGETTASLKAICYADSLIETLEEIKK
jgi:hypothetical protein